MESFITLVAGWRGWLGKRARSARLHCQSDARSESKTRGPGSSRSRQSVTCDVAPATLWRARPLAGDSIRVPFFKPLTRAESRPTFCRRRRWFTAQPDRESSPDRLGNRRSMRTAPQFSSFPGWSGSFPRRLRYVPVRASSFPGRLRNVPRRANPFPTRRGSFPGRASSVPPRFSFFPGRSRNAPGRASHFPGRAGSFPRQGGYSRGPLSSFPARRSSLPESASSFPGQGGNVPGRRNCLPGRRCSLPRRPRSLPGRASVPTGRLIRHSNQATGPFLAWRQTQPAAGRNPAAGGGVSRRAWAHRVHRRGRSCGRRRRCGCMPPCTREGGRAPFLLAGTWRRRGRSAVFQR